MKTYPFFTNTYRKGKLSYSYRRYIHRWKLRESNLIIRPGPHWLRPDDIDLDYPYRRSMLVYPCYSSLIWNVNRKMRKKK